jgi:DNA-binding PadR family transcriptional regulator
VLELAILGLLTEEPLHGYELKKQLADTLGFASGVSFGSLYPALGRLEAAGAVAVLEAEAEAEAAEPVAGTGRGTAPRGRRARKVYEITDAGRALFDELLVAESHANDDDKVFALRLAFARHLPPEARLGMLERRRARLAERLNRLGARVRAGVDRLDGYGRSLAEHDRETTAHDLRWIERLIASERAASAGRPAGPTPAPTISALRPPGHRTGPRPAATAHGRSTVAPAGHTGKPGHPKHGAPRPAPAATAATPLPTDPNLAGEDPVANLEDPQP